MSTSCTSSASLAPGAGSNGIGLESAGAGGNLYAALDLGSVATRRGMGAIEPDEAKDAAGPSQQYSSGGGRRNKRKNFQPRNIRTTGESGHAADQPLDLTETDSNEGSSSRKRSKLADDEDGRSTASGCSSTGDELAASSGHHHQQAVDLSVRPNSASSEYDDEGSLRMNMLLWQRSQLDRFNNQLPPADLSEAAVRHLIAGLYSLPGREALNGLDPRLPLQELQEVARKALNRPPHSPSTIQDHSADHHGSVTMTTSRLSDASTKETITSSASSAPQLPSVYDTLYKQKPIVEGSRTTSAEKRPGGSTGSGQGSKNNSPIDYSRYVKRFSSSVECASPHCKDLGHREHFHCVDCQSRVFVKKEEMIRHFKWHKKRDESLQHGFMRYSPGDDCNDRYSGCPHNRKQTHYHCVKSGCDKVYISTSDVQMHANYHRKDSAIIQEGFQRFRATEDCATAHCAFNGQRTTHFHCRRAPCNYTFKNKADMEKHKSYHIKDEQLTRDGFKKFMKNEPCNYENCRFSRVCNHIHCIRTGCNYVLHSSGQLYSHKRKHERRDAELAYQEGNSSNQMTSSNEAIPALAQTAAPNQPPEVQHPALPTAFGGLADVSFLMRDPSVAAAALLYGRIPPVILNQLDAVRQKYLEPQKPEQASFAGIGNDTPAKKFECRSIDCQFKLTEHFHCPYSECKAFNFRSLDSVTEHVSKHEKQDIITERYYVSTEEDDESTSCPIDCPHQNRLTHFHCCFDGCQEIVLASDDPFKRLDHYRTHERSRLTPVAHPLPATSATPSPQKNVQHSQTVSASVSLDSMFRRKRGRPPKNRVIEVWNESSPAHPGAMPDTPQAIFTSFKLPKPATPPLTHGSFNPFGLNVSSPLISNHHPLMRPSSPEQPAKRRETVKSAAIVQSAVIESSPSLSRSPESPARNLTVVKAAGTFFPSPALPSKHDESNHSNKHESPGSGNEGLDLSQGTVSRPSSSLERADSPEVSVAGDEANVKNSTSLTQEDPSFAYGPETSCGRPFCKLKRREHYHCVVCNQAFSEIDKLKPHMLKHCNGALSPSVSQLVNQPANQNEQERIKVENDRAIEPGPSVKRELGECSDAIPRPGAALLNFNQPLANSYGLPFHQPFVKSPGFLPAMQSLYATQGFMMNGSPGSSSGRQSSSSPVDQSIANPDAKKLRLQSSMRILKDEPVPEGYVRFRFNEDCQYPVCGYREHQTHFHCMRRDCGYSFCDKTRFVQHTARHERLDTLMGGDFQQYRANVNCGRPGCLYTATIATGQNKASHFHCLKCDFVCTDTNKVVAHRRQHQKTDSILAAGFEKFTPSQGCRVDACPHSTKQTHYHCLKCSYAVLGLAQMSAHKYRHMENSSTP